MLKIYYSYTDEFGQESTMNKTLEASVLEITDTLDLLVDNFKLFLISSGFLPEQVDKIKLED